MENVIIVLILVAAVGYGIYSFIHHLRHGGGCCGEHDAPAKKVRAADTNKSHYPHRLVMGVDGMTCQNCQRHVENALNTLPDTLAEVNLSARNVMVWTRPTPTRRSSARPSATQATCRCARRKRCDFSGTPSLYRTM